jgi:hypothetical protein
MTTSWTCHSEAFFAEESRFWDWRAWLAENEILRFTSFRSE